MEHHAREAFGEGGFARQLDDGRVSLGVEHSWAVEADSYLQAWEASRFLIKAIDASALPPDLLQHMREGGRVVLDTSGVNSSCADRRIEEIQYLHDGGAGTGGGAELQDGV
jgi:hypothetical protein